MWPYSAGVQHGISVASASNKRLTSWTISQTHFFLSLWRHVSQTHTNIQQKDLPEASQQNDRKSQIEEKARRSAQLCTQVCFLERRSTTLWWADKACPALSVNNLFGEGCLCAAYNEWRRRTTATLAWTRMGSRCKSLLWYLSTSLIV